MFFGLLDLGLGWQGFGYGGQNNPYHGGPGEEYGYGFGPHGESFRIDRFQHLVSGS